MAHFTFELQDHDKFRVLKIDRTDAKKLDITDDGVEYSAHQIEARHGIHT